jgi:MFS family permease
LSGIGAILSGPVADTYGRWPTFVVSTGGTIAFGLVSATSSTASQLILLRGITNFFGGIQQPTYTLLLEWLPAEYRGRVASGSGVFWVRTPPVGPLPRGLPEPSVR